MMRKNEQKATQRRVLATAVAMVFVLASVLTFAYAATAEHANHGTIKVHDDPDTEPEERNVPHVECDFWIQGFNMAHADGHLVFYGWPPTGDKSVVLEVNFTGEEQEDGHGFSFMVGPLELDPGHYRVEAYLDEGHPGGKEHAAKSKTFWVECDDEAEEPPVAPECPPAFDLSAEANDDTTITVTWNPDMDSDGTNLYRAVGGDDFAFVATFDHNNTTYVDDDTVANVTYEYYVTALHGDAETEPCEFAEATAREGGGGEPTPSECPPELDLRAEAHEDGTITVMWDPHMDSDGTNLYRAVGDGPFELVGTFDHDTTSHHDTDTELHETYTYAVSVLFGDEESERCESVQATAIPTFPTLVAAGLAVVASVLGYAMVSNRKH